MSTARLKSALVVILAAGFLTVLAVPHSSATPIISSEFYSPVLWGPAAVSSQFVEYSTQVTSSGTSADQQFLNVVRNDGTWVVQNLPVGFEPGTHAVSTNIDSSLFASGATYQTTLALTPATTAPVFSSGVIQNLSPSVNYLLNDGFGRTDKGPFVSPGLPSNLVLSFGPVVGVSYHTGVPDEAQGPNECAPTSAANSLTWLNAGGGRTTAQIRDILKNATHMKTDPLEGTTDDNFFAGKNQFVNENNLRIVTHPIAGGPNGPSIANILAELRKGQDVELALAWADPNAGGHWVTLVGLLDLGPFGAGIWFNDSDDGKTQTNWSWLDGDNGFSIRSYGKLNGGNVVDLAVAESVPEPTSLMLLCLGVLPLIFLNRYVI